MSSDPFDIFGALDPAGTARNEVDVLAAEAEAVLARKVRQEQRQRERGSSKAAGNGAQRRPSKLPPVGTREITDVEAADIVAEAQSGVPIRTGRVAIDPVSRRVSLRMETLLTTCADAAERCIRRADDHGPMSPYRVAELNAATRMLNAAASLAGTIGRLRGTGSTQTVRVEKVIVEDGGQAVVGAVSRSDAGGY